MGAWQRQALRQFRPASLAQLAWSYAALVYPPGPLLEALAAAAIPRIALVGPPELANTAWSDAVLPRPAFRPLLDAIAAQSLASICEFDLQHISVTAWSVAVRALPHPPLLHAIAASSIRRLSDF